jgi:hypothetical protein
MNDGLAGYPDIDDLLTLVPDSDYGQFELPHLEVDLPEA